MLGYGDQGASGYVLEAEITHTWGNQLANAINRLGGDVYVLQDGTSMNGDLTTPVNEANAYGLPWLYVSIHANAGGGTGYENYIYSGAWNNAGTAQLGWSVLNSYGAVAKKYGLGSRGLKAADFYVIANTRNRACLLELGFVDKYFDAQLLANATYRAEACDALARELMRIAGQTIKEPAVAPKAAAKPADTSFPLPKDLFDLPKGKYLLINQASGMSLACDMTTWLGVTFPLRFQNNEIFDWDPETGRLSFWHKGKEYALDFKEPTGVNGTQVCFFPPHGHARQKMAIRLLKKMADNIYMIRIHNRLKGRVLDVSGGQIAHNIPILGWQSGADSNGNQNWYAIKVG